MLLQDLPLIQGAGVVSFAKNSLSIHMARKGYLPPLYQQTLSFSQKRNLDQPFFFGLLVIFDNLVVLLSPLQKRVSKGCEMITLAQNSIYDLLKVRGTQKRRCQQCNLWCLQGIQPILMLLPQHRQVYMVNQVIQWLFLEARCRSQRACRLIIYQVILILIIYLRSAQLTKMRDISTQSMNESI